ncbi:Interleukin-24, partial [Heterocephalus glaber]
PLLQMGPWLQTAAFPLLGLILLLWSQVPGLQGHEFRATSRFGPCRVEGVALPSLWEAFRSLKDTVQAQDNITSIRLLRREVLQNVSDTESCHLIHDLLKFYLNTVFKNYHHKIAESNMLPSFSTLANNFVFIVSKLQPTVFYFSVIQQKNEMLSVSDRARRRFLMFKRAFKQLEIEAALTKAFGEVDILLTWMGRFYR